MTSHSTRGAEALPTIKIMEQELDTCERALSRHLSKVGEVATSVDESAIRELITNIKASREVYSNQNKRLSTRKRELGCVLEANNLTKTRFNLTHHDAPEAVDLLNQQLVELGLEACSHLSISGSQSVSELSETTPRSISNAQYPTVTFKPEEPKDISRALSSNQDHFKEVQSDSSRVPPRSSFETCDFSQSLRSPVKEIDSILNTEYVQPISYLKDANKVSIIPPKDDHAYNVLQETPFTDGPSTSIHGRRKPDSKYQNYLTELELLNDKYQITSVSRGPNSSHNPSVMPPLAPHLADSVAPSCDSNKKYPFPYNQTYHQTDYSVNSFEKGAFSHSHVPCYNPPLSTDVTWSKQIRPNQSSQVEPSNCQRYLRPDRQSLHYDNRQSRSLPPTAGNVQDNQNISPQSENNIIPPLDSFYRLTLRQDLMKGYGEIFEGDPECYWSWKDFISSQLAQIHATPEDSILILKANTKGRPQQTIKNAMIAGMGNPSDTLRDIWRELEDDFGSDLKISTHLFRKLEEFPKIDKPSQINEMEKLLSLGRVMEASASHCASLRSMNYSFGPQATLWGKMPDDFKIKWRSKSYNREMKLKDLLKEMARYIGEHSDPRFQNVKIKPHRVLATNAIAPTVPETSNTETVPRRVSFAETPPSRTRAKCAVHPDLTSHDLSQCFTFRKFSPEERHKIVQESKLCYMCLGPHFIGECSNPVSCDVCGKHHNTLIHRSLRKTAYSGRNGGSEPSSRNEHPVRVERPNPANYK